MSPAIVAIVPMRHHSVRVPGKNYRPIRGLVRFGTPHSSRQPLYHYILKTLLAVPELTQILVDTDSPIVQQGCAEHFPSVLVIQRPEHLRADTCPMNDVLLNACSHVDADFYLQTHSTNPLLSPETVSRAIRELISQFPQRDSLFAVKRHQTRLWDGVIRPLNHNPDILLRTQDLPPVFEENSCIYIFTKSSLERRHNRIGSRPIMFEMDKLESQDIDDESDFLVAEALIQARAGRATVEPAMPGPEIAPVALIKEYTVLVTAPYMIAAGMDRFMPLFNRFGIKVIVPEVRERCEAAQLMEYAGTFDGAVCGDDRYTPEVLAACAPRLKVISKWGTGVDSIDAAACDRLGVQLCRTLNAFSEPVADTCLGLALAFARGLPSMDRRLKAGEWAKFPARAMNESTFGVVGVGNVGKAVLRRAKGFGLKLLGTDIQAIDPAFIAEVGVEMTTLDDLLARSDFVSMNTDLNPTSRNLINATTLAKMKPTAYLINTSRGPVVDEPALVKALTDGTIAGAGLDVYVDEPLPDSSPLKKMDNVLLGTHNSNSSPKAWERVHWNTLNNLVVGLGFKVKSD